MSSSYEQLRVWQQAKDLAILVYKTVRLNQELKNDFGLRDQMQRSAVSIPSNIAEGEASGTIKNSIRYLNIALGSAAELKTQIIIAYEINFIDQPVFEELKYEITDLEVGFHNLIKARLNK